MRYDEYLTKFHAAGGILDNVLSPTKYWMLGIDPEYVAARSKDGYIGEPRKMRSVYIAPIIRRIKSK